MVTWILAKICNGSIYKKFERIGNLVLENDTVLFDNIEKAIEENVVTQQGSGKH